MNIDHVLVIIPSHNSAAFIEETLEGIRNQQGDAILHIVIFDDSSVDTTCREIISYRKKHRELDIALVRRPKGLDRHADVRNQAINYALEHKIPFGYIALCDHDDIWLPHKLSGQLKLFAEDPFLGLVYCRGIIIRTEDEDIVVRRRLVDSFWKLMLFFHITASSVVLRRSAVEEFIPLFTEESPKVFAPDSECWARLLSHGVRVGATTTLDLIYRFSRRSMSNIRYRDRRANLRILYRSIRRRTGRSRALLFFCLQLKLLRYSTLVEKIEPIMRRNRGTAYSHENREGVP